MRGLPCAQCLGHIPHPSCCPGCLMVTPMVQHPLMEVGHWLRRPGYPHVPSPWGLCRGSWASSEGVQEPPWVGTSVAGKVHHKAARPLQQAVPMPSSCSAQIPSSVLPQGPPLPPAPPRMDVAPQLKDTTCRVLHTSSEHRVKPSWGVKWDCPRHGQTGTSRPQGGGGGRGRRRKRVDPRRAAGMPSRAPVEIHVLLSPCYPGSTLRYTPQCQDQPRPGRGQTHPVKQQQAHRKQLG